MKDPAAMMRLISTTWRPLLEKALEHEIDLFIDPHQDVWSRFSGGDGAPAWTFEAAGMDVERFQQTGAALLHQERPDDFPHMLWANNYYRFAAFTMFTLFLRRSRPSRPS